MGHVAPALQAGTLTEALRQRTWALHTAAERSGIINDILRKKADRNGYALLLRNVIPAYRAMERALERHRHLPMFQVFARPELYRADKIAADLSVIAGLNWERDLVRLPAADDYAACIAQSAEGGGARLVAHAYVRYFGDLSGGQILKGLLGKTLGLQPEALSFYEFPGIDDPSAFKNAMRRAIDVDAAAACEPEIVIDEAMRAFEHNIAVSTAVQDFLKRNA
ncbi:MAG: biliverdin-producing heme oxygenase [Pseudolabrys sp.]|nr:biliverdin-producing heme oxygenase [Pseudolabrys sp.]